MKFRELFGFTRDKPTDQVGQGVPFVFGRTSAGKIVNERTAMQTSAVYACVRVLSEAVASLPLNIYSYGEDGGKVKEYDHPLYRLLHSEPNPEMTSFTFREVMMTHLLLYGNSYTQIIRDGAGRVVALYPLMPNCIEEKRDDNGKLQYIYTKASDENPNLKDDGQIVLQYEEVMHVTAMSMDGLVGASPIATSKNSIAIALSAEEFGASFFKNGAYPGGVLEHPGVLKNPDKVRESWNSIYQGSNNGHKIAVLEEGMHFSPISLNPDALQLSETRHFQLEEIARIFRVPLHLINSLDHATYSNIEHQSIEFVKYSVQPWVIRIEQEMEKSLLLPSEKGKYSIKMNVDGLMRGDYKSRMEGYSIGRNGGWLSTNDIREMENMNPVSEEDGGNLYLINGAMCKLADAGIYADKHQTQEDKATNRKRGK